ncbi:MAG TPA: hypothetical protein VD973_26630 [Symbiobacteriaceae bacterium]|jgi:hypothetical protein|nr:hypothetical protein [Symbiobacteriaceae bacterium]
MLKNTFRKFTGILILLVFGVAVIQFFRQTSSDPYLWNALAFGSKIVLFLALVLWLVFLADRRMNKRQQ